MKNKEELRIVYMGTPDFAVESLRALVEGGYNVVAVVTMPDKPMGRHGSVLQPSPVKQYAVEHGLKVMQPEKLKDPAFVWSMPPLGTFNAHASLLPKYRGAAPINWAVINGETETGITTFFLKHEIDTGDIIQQVKIPIEETDNVEVVHDKLMVLSGKLVTETVDNIIAGTVTSVPQDHFKDVPLTPAPKIFRETCRIDWNQPTKRIYDFIRGLSPYPAAWTTLEGKSVKIYEAETLSALTGISPVNGESHTGCVPGTISLVKSPHGLCVATADGWLNIKTLQLEGKKKMPVTDLLRGLKIKENAFFV